MPAETAAATRSSPALPAVRHGSIGFNSPIAELLAAIEAEQTAPRACRRARKRIARAEPVTAGSRRKIELDPAIADFLGIKPRGQSARVALPPQPQVQPQVQPQPRAAMRELRVEQRSSGRVASDAGLAGRLLPVSR